MAACPDEADKFFDYLAASSASQVRRGRDLQIMFGIGGERDLHERELEHLGGWRDSSPVRVGNGAWNQRQLDVYGELLDAAVRLPDQLDRMAPATREFLADLADGAAARWAEQDQGIWEVRGEPRDFLYSKLMCWVALDRAIGLAERIGAADRVERWAAVRKEIADAILTRGWNEEVGCFTQSFGSAELDASNLMMPIVGFIDATDPRMRATIDATAERLTDERRPGLPLPGPRRARGGGGHVPAVHVLAGRGAGAGRRVGPGPQDLRGSDRLCQRRGPAGRGGRPGHG